MMLTPAVFERSLHCALSAYTNGICIAMPFPRYTTLQHMHKMVT